MKFFKNICRVKRTSFTKMNVKANHDTGFEKDDQCVLCDTIFRIICPYCRRKKTALLTLRQKIPRLQYFSVRTIKELAVQHFITF